MAMARKTARKRADTLRLTRHTSLPQKSLGHTVSRSRAFYEPFSPFGLPPPVRPLIRTVLVDSDFQTPPRSPGVSSPLVRSRATGRSSDRKVRSPFLNATMLMPELTERAVVCARRGIRREVLFAIRKTGKGSRSPRRKRSSVRC